MMEFKFGSIQKVHIGRERNRDYVTSDILYREVFSVIQTLSLKHNIFALHSEPLNQLRLFMFNC